MLKLARASIDALPEASVTTLLPRGNIAPAFVVESEANVTVAPDTRLSNLSLIVTRSELRTVPTSTVCDIPPVAETLAGGVDGPTLTGDPNDMRRGVVVDCGGANLGIVPVARPVCTAPVAEKAVPVGPMKTCAFTGVEGSGREALPNPTFVQVIQRTSVLA